MKSIIQSEKECYVCGTKMNLHCHHCIYGTSNRKNSEKYGLKVWLCQEHHTGDDGVHHDRIMDLMLKRKAQKHFEKHHGNREDFIRVFGKNYL